MARTHTAAALVAERQDEAARLLALIAERLEAHLTRAAADPANWGYAGDLGSVVANLADVADFLRP